MSRAGNRRGPRFNLLLSALRARGPGRGRPAATGSLANAIGRAKTAGGPALTSSCQPYAREGQAVVGPRYLRGRSPTRSVAPKPPGGPALTSFVTLTRARARPWSARGYGVARQRDRSRQNRRGPALTPLSALRARGPGRGRPAATGSLANAIGRAKTAGGLGRASLRHFGPRAWVPNNLARRVFRN